MRERWVCPPLRRMCRARNGDTTCTTRRSFLIGTASSFQRKYFGRRMGDHRSNCISYASHVSAIENSICSATMQHRRQSPQTIRHLPPILMWHLVSSSALTSSWRRRPSIWSHAAYAISLCRRCGTRNCPFCQVNADSVSVLIECFWFDHPSILQVFKCSNRGRTHTMLTCWQLASANQTKATLARASTLVTMVHWMLWSATRRLPNCSWPTCQRCPAPFYRKPSHPKTNRKSITVSHRTQQWYSPKKIYPIWISACWILHRVNGTTVKSVKKAFAVTMALKCSHTKCQQMQ